MAAPLSAGDLVGVWVRTPEHDEGELAAYRRAAAVGRSRPRERLELDADGTLRHTRPGPDDRPVRREGRWELDGAELVLRAAGAPEVRYEVVRVDDDALRVRRAS
jgi:hypothetical protein